MPIEDIFVILGQIVQNFFSLTRSFMTNSLNVLAWVFSNTLLLLLQKGVSSSCFFFSKNINAIAIFQDRNFNVMLANNLLSFERLGPAWYCRFRSGKTGSSPGKYYFQFQVWIQVAVNVAMWSSIGRLATLLSVVFWFVMFSWCTASTMVNSFSAFLYKVPFQKVIDVQESNRITKTRLYNFDPLKPHFYIVKLGFTGVYIIFLISAQKHRLWVLVRTALARRF